MRHPINVRKLELGHCFLTMTNLPSVLKTVAISLEHFTLSEVKNFRPIFIKSFFGEDNPTIVFPVMAKLRVVEFLQAQDKDNRLENNALVVPNIKLKFEGSTDVIRLNYNVQFPIIKSIRISRDEKCRMFSSRYACNVRLTEEEYFEASVSFLYDSFLNESNSTSGTVKQLDVPFPSGDRFRLVGVMECHCEKYATSCRCFEWRKSSHFWDRVLAIFPNVRRYQAMEKGRNGGV